MAAADGASRRLHLQLVHWGVGDDVNEEALLVATELLANVVDHARTPFVLSVRLDGPLLRVSVSDRRVGVPELRPANLAAGRVSGLRMVGAVATRWGWREDGSGKTVWADFVV